MDDAAAERLLAIAEEASPKLRGPEAKAGLGAMEAEREGLLAAVRWFVDHERPNEALRLANALNRYWITQQRFDEGDEWFAVALNSGDGEPKLRGAASINAGFMPFWLGHDDRAAALFGQGLAIGRELGDVQLMSQALGGLARVEFRRNVAEGRRLAQEALDIAVAAGDEAGRSNALHLLGVGAQIAGDLPEARAWMVQRLAAVRGSGNEFLIASEASNLSMVERQLGNLDGAETLAREALEIGGRIGDQFTRPFAIAGLAAIGMERGDLERAATLVGAAEAIMAAQNMAWPPDERPHYEHMLARLPEGMGAAAFDRARAAGRSMSPDEVTALALGTS